jgi:hypothetical protein
MLLLVGDSGANNFTVSNYNPSATANHTFHGLVRYHRKVLPNE